VAQAKEKVEMEIEEVAETTYRLEVRVLDARYIFAVYLLGGKEAVLIDPGPSVTVPHILEGMKQLSIRQLSVIIPTHIHMDHGGGAGTLAEHFPGAKVVVHPRARKHAVDPSRLIDSTRAAYSDDFEDTYGPILPIAETRLDVADDGHVIDAAERQLRIIHAPGHAFHHMTVFDEKTGGLFCGEALGLPVSGREEIVLPAVSVGDLDVDSYLESIEKLRKLRPKLLFYPHDGGVRKPEGIFSRISQSTAMLREVILEGLTSGSAADDIALQVQRRLFGQPNPGESIRDMASIILGHEAYFRRKGLL